MSETNISPDKVTGQVIEAEHVNELKNAMITTFSGRDSSGTVAPNQQLGSATYPWGLAYINSLISNGKLVDLEALVTESNIIKSGQVRATSQLPDFIRANGSNNTATVQGATTNLITVINGATTILDNNVVLNSLTTASSGASSQCIINDANLIGQLNTKYLGEENDSIIVDNMGANILAKIGQVVCFKTGTEYLLAYVKSSTELTNCRRGLAFDSLGDPIKRVTLLDNDIFNLMSLGWVFMEDDAATFDVSYNSPIYDFDQPNSPATGDYWFDLQNKQWRRFNGADFVVINRILIGLVVMDSVNCVASRSMEYDIAYDKYNTIDFDREPFSETQVQTNKTENITSVNATFLEWKSNPIEFDITTDRDVGVIESPDTLYYMYITEEGDSIISDERPYDFNPKLKGYYHPYQSWRCVGSFFNDNSSNITKVSNILQEFNVILDEVCLKNGFIDPAFDIWDQGESFTTGGYTSVSWKYNAPDSGAFTVSKLTLSPGDIPGLENVTSATRISRLGDNSWFGQPIANVGKYAGKEVTISFYAKAASPYVCNIKGVQDFGNGGSPSPDVPLPFGNISLTTSWSRYSITTLIPSISGKTLGDEKDHLLIFWGQNIDDNVQVDFTAMQINEGKQAAPFCVEPLNSIRKDTELFFERHIYGLDGVISMAAVQSSQSAFGEIVYRTQKKTTPIVSSNFGITAFWALWAQNSVTSLNDTPFFFRINLNKCVIGYNTPPHGKPTGYAGLFLANGAGPEEGYIDIDSRI